MAISNDNPSTPLSQRFIQDNPINTLTMLLDEECIDNIHQSIQLSLQLPKLNPNGEYSHAIKQELTALLAEVGLVTMWTYQEWLLSVDQGKAQL